MAPRPYFRSPTLRVRGRLSGALKSRGHYKFLGDYDPVVDNFNPATATGRYFTDAAEAEGFLRGRFQLIFMDTVRANELFSVMTRELRIFLGIENVDELIDLASDLDGPLYQFISVQ